MKPSTLSVFDQSYQSQNRSLYQVREKLATVNPKTGRRHFKNPRAVNWREANTDQVQFFHISNGPDEPDPPKFEEKQKKKDGVKALAQVPRAELKEMIDAISQMKVFVRYEKREGLDYFDAILNEQEAARNEEEVRNPRPSKVQEMKLLEPTDLMKRPKTHQYEKMKSRNFSNPHSQQSSKPSYKLDGKETRRLFSPFLDHFLSQQEIMQMLKQIRKAERRKKQEEEESPPSHQATPEVSVKKQGKAQYITVNKDGGAKDKAGAQLSPASGADPAEDLQQYQNPYESTKEMGSPKDGLTVEKGIVHDSMVNAANTLYQKQYYRSLMKIQIRNQGIKQLSQVSQNSPIKIVNQFRASLRSQEPVAGSEGAPEMILGSLKQQPFMNDVNSRQNQLLIQHPTDPMANNIFNQSTQLTSTNMKVYENDGYRGERSPLRKTATAQSSNSVSSSDSVSDLKKRELAQDLEIQSGHASQPVQHMTSTMYETSDQAGVPQDEDESGYKYIDFHSVQEADKNFSHLQQFNSSILNTSVNNKKQRLVSKKVKEVKQISVLRGDNPAPNSPEKRLPTITSSRKHTGLKNTTSSKEPEKMSASRKGMGTSAGSESKQLTHYLSSESNLKLENQYPKWFLKHKEVMKQFGIDLEAKLRENLENQSKKQSKGSMERPTIIKKTYNHDNRRVFNKFTQDEKNPQLKQILTRMHLAQIQRNLSQQPTVQGSSKNTTISARGTASNQQLNNAKSKMSVHENSPSSKYGDFSIARDRSRAKNIKLFMGSSMLKPNEMIRCRTQMSGKGDSRFSKMGTIDYRGGVQQSSEEPVRHINNLLKNPYNQWARVRNSTEVKADNYGTLPSKPAWQGSDVAQKQPKTFQATLEHMY